MNVSSLRLTTHFLFATLLLSGTSTIAMAKSIADLHRHPESGRWASPSRSSIRPPARSRRRRWSSRRAIPRTSRCRTTASTCTCATPARRAASAPSRSDRKTGALRLLNYKESKGRGPSYVSVDGSGKYVLDANYGGGFIEVYSLTKDGSLDQQTAFVQHIGSSVHPRAVQALRALVPHRSL